MMGRMPSLNLPPVPLTTIIDAILLHVVKLNRLVWDVCYFLSEALLILLWDPKLPPFWTGFEIILPPRMVQWERKRSHLFEVSFNKLTSGTNIPQNKKMEKSIRKTKKKHPKKSHHRIRKKWWKKNMIKRERKPTPSIQPRSKLMEKNHVNLQFPNFIPQVSQPFAAPVEGSCDNCRRHHCGNGNWPGNWTRWCCRNPTCS